MSKHTKTLQNSLKTLKKQQGTTLEVMGDKLLRILCKTTWLPPTLKSNVVLNVSSINSHKKQTDKQTTNKHDEYGKAKTRQSRV